MLSFREVATDGTSMSFGSAGIKASETLATLCGESYEKLVLNAKVILRVVGVPLR